MKQNFFKIFDLSLMNFHGLKYKMFNLIFIGSIIENVCLSVCILSILAFILLNFSWQFGFLGLCQSIRKWKNKIGRYRHPCLRCGWGDKTVWTEQFYP